MESFANSHYLPQWSARRWSSLRWYSCWCAFSGSTATSGGARKSASKARTAPSWLCRPHPPASPGTSPQSGEELIAFLLVEDGLDLLAQPVERVETVKRRFRTRPVGILGDLDRLEQQLDLLRREVQGLEDDLFGPAP